MIKSFSKELLITYFGDLAKDNSYAADYFNDESIFIHTLINLPSLELNKKLKFVREQLTSPEENTELIIGLAEILLPLFEEEYPSDNRPRIALGLSRKAIAGKLARQKVSKARLLLKNANNNLEKFQSFDDFAVDFANKLNIDLDSIPQELLSTYYHSAYT